MPNQQERAELHKTIWKIANDLRGSVDGWEFKAYVLGSIFYRFISENLITLQSATRWQSASVRRW
ncbi:type I restriction-modification system subunit M N-terminal domain-containing protein [uncultured Prevotella sp.]|uniref:type I restriction-modification system subunit M N-terminal domain-containing protein n=1 Tax=uncultured Prevotella sp. TaxID=159272 RepID=UPI00258E28DA|nr:type I restriction-modification system subunit M N-terminal domain-containing protein [uncultured Prevotella sp.]